MSTETIALPEEAAAHLEQIADEKHRAAITERVGTLAVLDVENAEQSLERQTTIGTAEAEPSPYGQTELTAGLITSISRRANIAASEVGGQEGYYDAPGTSVWSKVLESELTDIELANESGDQTKVKDLLVEHMATLELAEIGRHKSDRPMLSMLKLAQLGLAETAIEASRESYGLVVATSETPFFGDLPPKAGKPVVLAHEIHSVAHTFEDVIPGLEVGLGKHISIDPEELAISEATTEAITVDKLDTVNMAIAAAVRSTSAERQGGRKPEDEQLIGDLNHRFLRRISGRDGSYMGTASTQSDSKAMEALEDVTPDLATSSEYDADFAAIRQDRLVGSIYRGNQDSTSRLDTDIVLLVADGRTALAKRLITTNPAELINPDYPENGGALGFAAKYVLQEKLDDTSRESILSELRGIQAEKAASLQAGLDKTLADLPLDDFNKRSLANVVSGAQDPESALRSLEAIQQVAAEKAAEPDMIAMIAKQLSDDVGWNESRVIDVITNPEASALLFFREDFQKLIADRNIGRQARNKLLYQPDRAEQIIQMINHPAVQKILEQNFAPGVIYDSIRDSHVAEKTMARIDSVSTFAGHLDTQQFVKCISDENAADFIRLVKEVDGESDFLTSFKPENIKLLLSIGLDVPQDTQLRVILNAQKLDSQPHLMDFVREADLDDYEISMISKALLSSDNFQTRAADISRAFSETKLGELIGNQGVARALAPTILRTLTQSEHPLDVAKQLSGQLLSNDPLWLQCYKISQVSVGNIETRGFQEGLIVKEIPLALPSPQLSHDESANLLSSSPPTSFTEMSLEQKRQVAQLDGMSDEQVTALSNIEFNKLKPEFQEALLAYRLFETITLSRDAEARAQASERNLHRSASGTWLQAGDLVHATNSSINLRAILTSGAMAGEALGMRGGADSFPFNLDTVVASSQVMSQPDYPSRLQALRNGSYGGIALVFGRGFDALHRGEEFQGGFEEHRLILGGLPSTEISALLLRGTPDEKVIADVKRIVAESDMYIPVVSPSGELLLSREEFDNLRDDLNITAAHPELFDSAFERANSQSGSNEGAEFLLPKGAGEEPEHWYVKFGDDNPDRLWTEILSDEFYRQVVPAVVPETRAIIVEGRLARASKMVPIDGAGLTDEARNEAFIMDCLLGNWDAVYNSSNIIMSGGHGLRIDTGNGLDFRARGDKKPDGAFTSTVSEVETGTSQDSLGDGMRQMYPGLTNSQISQQVRTMQARLSDETIDHLVDSIRRPEADRTELKRTMKERRDYILNYFSRTLGIEG